MNMHRDTQPTGHDLRYAPPTSPVADLAPPSEGLQLATRSRRFWAVIIDAVIQGLALGLVAVATPYNPFESSDPGWWSVNLASALIGAIAFALLHGYLLLRHGQTIGKYLLKIRIVRPSGEAVSAARLCARYGPGFATGGVVALSIAYSLVDSLLIFRASRRCLHDVIADTVVIKV